MVVREKVKLDLAPFSHMGLCNSVFNAILFPYKKEKENSDINGHLNIGTSMINTKIMHNRKV